MMAQTVSVHNGNSGKVAQEHNARDAEYLKYHVNQEGVIPGGYYKIIVHEPEADAINRIFSDALEEYNAKKRADVKHPGREIPDYYEHIKSQLDESKKRKSVKGNKGGFEMMQPCYETILQIGNIETVNSHADDNFDQERLDPLLAEEMILEAVERTKANFLIPAVDKDGNPILDENGNQKQWCCIEIIGLYIHDDEVLKGIHAHVDYVPVAHNYKRGLSMQPGLTKALEEMGLFQDRLEDLAEERTRLMMEKFGIDYHDSDYVDEKGKQLPKSKLTKEQLDNRKMASELVPCRTPQMKLQDLFRENLKAVMQEHSVPVAETTKDDRVHVEKRGWADAMRAKAVTKEAKMEKAAIDNEIAQKNTELSELDEKLEQEKSDIKLIEDKRASLSSWDKKPKSERELFDQINKEVLDHKSLTGHKSKLVPLELWEVLKKIIKNYFRMEQENKSLRASTAIEKVKEAESIIDKKDKIISDAKDEADEIIAAGKKEVLSIRGKSQFIKENEELKSQLDIYDSVMERNPEFARAVEQEERKRKLFKVKGKKQEVAL